MSIRSGKLFKKITEISIILIQTLKLNMAQECLKLFYSDELL